MSNSNWRIPPNTSIRRFLQLVVALAFAMLVVWVFVMSQNEMDSGSGMPEYNPADSASVVQKQRLDSLRKAIGRDAAEVKQREETESWMSRTIPIIVLFLIVLGAMLWWARKREGDAGGTIFKEVAQQQLAPGQTIKVIEVNGEYWVLGVTGNSITLLDKLNPEEWSPSEAAGQASKSDKTGTSFAQLFDGFKRNG